MKKRHWLIVVPAMAAVMAAMLALISGAGFAFAQDQPAQGQTQTQGQGPGGPGRARLARHMMAGEVVKVEDNTITLNTLKNGEKSVKVDDKTKYRKDGKDATLGDVTQGEKVAIVLGKKPDDGSDPVARAVIVNPPAPRDNRAVGTVKAVNGDTVTLQTPQGDKQVKIPAVTQGMRLGVVTGPDGSVIGLMYNPPEKPQGAPAAPPEGGPPEGEAPSA
ncbi:MAG: hypothetical protein ACYC6Z_01590 [Thermoleophilia bacterium]